MMSLLISEVSWITGIYNVIDLLPLFELQNYIEYEKKAFIDFNCFGIHGLFKGIKYA